MNDDDKKFKMQKCAKTINNAEGDDDYDFGSFLRDLKALLASTDEKNIAQQK